MHCGKRVEEYRLQDIKGFDQLPDEELNKISTYISNHWTANGQNYVGGHLRSLGLRIQGRRIRESIGRVHPQNTALRWGGGGGCFSSNLPSSMAKFTVWHLDGHHSLIRWKIVIHGCIDGFSRRIIFLRRNSNNLADTVLDLFQAVQKDENLWPSRKRVEKGVEKVLVCDAMVQARGDNRGSVIAGPSSRSTSFSS